MHPNANHRRRLLPAIFALVTITFGCADSEPPPLTLPAETVTVTRDATHGRTWRAAFDVELLPEQVLIVLRLRLVPGPGITRPRLDRWTSSWEADVEARWSGQFALLVGDAARPINVDVQFDNRRPHHTVVVREDAGAGIDQLNWSIWSSPVVVAHEVGHMIGAWDEYPRGGQDPHEPMSDPNSVMGGADGPEVQVASRHFNALAPWAQARLGAFELARTKPAHSGAGPAD